MKTFKYLLIALLFTVTNLSAQHLTFKDIPITGHMDVYAQKLVAQGYKIESKGEQFVSLVGQFAGSKCDILVLGSKKSKTTWKVVAYFPKKTTWLDLKSEYELLKNSLIKKYGDSESYESFLKPYYEGDDYEMQAVRTEKIIWKSFWENNIGYITLGIKATERVSISFEDKTNSQLDDQEKGSIINSDI
jgi:hypothetical protein